MKRALVTTAVALIVFTAAGMSLSPANAATPQRSERFAAGQTAYDEDQYAEAAEIFVGLLAERGAADGEKQIKEREQAAYLLTVILFFQTDADPAAIVDGEAQLDEGIERVASAVRAKDVLSASQSMAFLRFREADLPLVTRRLLATMESFTSPVEGEYAGVWEREIAHAVDISVDGAGRLWVFVAEPTAFLRLDRLGEIVERIPFVAPDTLDAEGFGKARFAMHPDGGFQLGAHRYAADGKALGVSRIYPPEDTAVAGDGATLFLHNDGLRAVGRDGAVQWQRLGRGRREGSFNHPRSMALDGEAIVVAEFRRLQRFSKTGEFESALTSDAAPKLPDGFKVNGMNDIASAGGRLFVGHFNARTVDVYTRGFQPIATFRLPAQRVAASIDGMVFGLKSERLSAGIKVPAASRAERAVREAPQLEPRQSLAQKSWRSEVVPIEFVPLERPPKNVRIHVSTQNVTSLAGGSLDLQSIVIGTYGGVLRYRPDLPGQTGWSHWSRMDGLPSDVIQDVHESADGSVWAVGGGDIVVRKPGESSWSRLERKGFGINGKAVIGDSRHPNSVWIAAQRGLFHLDAASNEAGFVPMKLRSPEEVVELPDGRLFVRLGVDGVASIDPATGETNVLVEMEDLRRFPGLRDPKRDRWIMTLSADPTENVLWLGTDQRELFAFDLETGRVRNEWLDGAFRPACRRGEIRARRVAGALHILGHGCYAVLDPKSRKAPVVFEHPGRGVDLLRAREDVLLATTEGLYRVDATGSADLVARPTSEPPDWYPISLTQVDGRVWVGFGNQGVGIYDGHAWSEVEVAGSVGRFRVEPQGVLAVASYGNGGTYRIDRDGAGFERVAPGGRSWSYMRDLLFDGDQWWAIGGPDPKRKQGIRRFRDGRNEHWGRAAGMPFGEARRIVADPETPDVLWIASDAGLVRFEKDSQQTQVVWPGNVSWLDRFDDGSLWAYGSELLRFDPRTGLGSPFPFAGIPAPDPHDPKTIWVVHKKKLLRVDNVTGGVLSTHEIGIGSLHARGLEILPTDEGWAAWIAGSGGLVEVRIARDSVPAAIDASSR